MILNVRRLEAENVSGIKNTDICGVSFAGVVHLKGILDVVRIKGRGFRPANLELRTFVPICYAPTKTKLFVSLFDRIFSSFGSPLSFFPLAVSKLGISADNNESEKADNYGHPIPLRISKEAKPFVASGLFLIALLFFGISLWLIKSASSIEDIRVIDIAKIVLGIVLIFGGWAAEDASLELIDLGRIYGRVYCEERVYRRQGSRVPQVALFYLGVLFFPSKSHTAKWGSLLEIS